jgi:predicted enzyme related to lactoylglutathione lyase
MGVAEFGRSRAFYEQIGARFDGGEPVGGIVSATIGGTRLVFEAGSGGGAGPALLFDVPDADALHAELVQVGCGVEAPPKDEPWGRQFNVRDPDGHLIAFIGPVR